MLGFLRRIRKSLLQQNKFTRYLLYAIGEVFLIVIGILIALGLNNWNENRKLREREQFYLAGLREEFEFSKRKLENLIEVNRENYEQSRKIADYITNRVPPLQEEELSMLILNSFRYEISYNPNNSLLEEIINSGALKDISNAELRSYLTSWESRIQSIHRQENTLRNDHDRVLEIIRRGDGSLRTILDNAEVTTTEMGLLESKNKTSNLSILDSPEFDNNLLMFILSAMVTENSHYKPLLKDIDNILVLIDSEVELTPNQY